MKKKQLEAQAEIMNETIEMMIRTNNDLRIENTKLKEEAARLRHELNQYGAKAEILKRIPGRSERFITRGRTNK